MARPKMTQALTKAEQEELNSLLMEDSDSERLAELVWDTPVFLKEIAVELIEVDEHYNTKDYIYKCQDGRYFCLTLTQHNSMRDLESAYFYEVVPKEIKKIIYEPKEN